MLDKLYLSITNTGKDLLEIQISTSKVNLLVHPNNSVCVSIPANAGVTLSGATTAAWQVAVPVG
jgi:hypothetical protein